jgi:hypothetical protein
LKYRANIDGLRAIAVQSVIAYHYGVALSGGFTGVDVFFVIGGFLITQQLVTEIAAGTFSVLKFLRSANPPHLADEAMLLALASIALAALSYRFVETPFRRYHPPAVKTVRAGALACLLVFCSSMYLDSADGLPKRVSQAVYPMRSLEAMWEWPCPHFEFVPSLRSTYCSFGQPWTTAKTKAVIWGDSHSEHFAPMMQLAKPDTG